jgi:hypothetical protein
VNALVDASKTRVKALMSASKTRVNALMGASKTRVDALMAGGGAEGGRTPDLLIANEALSQLSYGPAKIQLRRKSLRVGAI